MTIDYPEQQGLYDSKYEHDSCGIGFVANIKGEQSNDIIRRGLEALECMVHRGAESADNKTGDGAGILIQIPHKFLAEEIPTLPQLGQYGTGIVFLPQKPDEADYCAEELAKIVNQERLQILAWREVPVDHDAIGAIARAAEPVMQQIFITSPVFISQNELERKLYLVRKQIEKTISESWITQKRLFYISSLSTKTIIYKGMFMSG